MNIFNSLGSDYTARFAWRSLWVSSGKQRHAQLTDFLAHKYGGEVTLVYKGREAIQLALQAVRVQAREQKNAQSGELAAKLNEPATRPVVAINGFTCYAVYQAIVDAGCTPYYLDVAMPGLDFSATELEQALQTQPGIRVVMVQNTLGYPAQTKAIAQLCRERGIVLIEDLAHSIGLTYASGEEAGTLGDFVVLSFSQDKVVDGVSGGALVVRNPQYQSLVAEPTSQMSWRIQLKEWIYPLLTWKIRITYAWGVGRVLHRACNQLGWLPRPVVAGVQSASQPASQSVSAAPLSASPRSLSPTDAATTHQLPNWYCARIQEQFAELSANLEHKKNIAAVYAQTLNKRVLQPRITQYIPQATNLRFPIFVEQRESLVKFLKTNGVYVSDIWYDAPVAPRKYLHLTDYVQQCPQAEEISRTILNLPTHVNVSKSQARQISELVNSWLQRNRHSIHN